MSRMSQSEFETRGAVDVFEDSISKVGFASDHFKLMVEADNEAPRSSLINACVRVGFEGAQNLWWILGNVVPNSPMMGKSIPKHGKRVKEALRNLWVTELHAPGHLIAQFLVGH